MLLSNSAHFRCKTNTPQFVGLQNILYNRKNTYIALKQLMAIVKLSGVNMYQQQICKTFEYDTKWYKLNKCYNNVSCKMCQILELCIS